MQMILIIVKLPAKEFDLPLKIINVRYHAEILEAIKEHNINP